MAKKFRIIKTKDEYKIQQKGWFFWEKSIHDQWLEYLKTREKKLKKKNKKENKMDYKTITQEEIENWLKNNGSACYDVNIVTLLQLAIGETSLDEFREWILNDRLKNEKS